MANEPLATVAPPDVVYHIIELPVADKLDTCGLVPLQNVCEALPVGAEGVVFTVAVTSNLALDSQPFSVEKHNNE